MKIPLRIHIGNRDDFDHVLGRLHIANAHATSTDQPDRLPLMDYGTEPGT